MLINTIRDFFRKNKKILFFTFFVFLVFQFDLSFAEDPAKGGAIGGDANTLIDAVNMIIKIGATVLALITELVGWFLSPSWTTGKAIGFGYHLKELWIMISNVVYLMFAIILVWIAFMNILGKTGDWELKQAMPKFIVGVLIVPFSWFIVSAIIGISSILTASVLSIPRDSFPAVYSSLDNVKFYKTYTFNIGKSEGKDNKAIEADDETTFGEFMQDQNNMFGIMNVYTFGIMRVDANGNLNIGDIKGKITTLTALGVKGVFDVLFFIGFLLLMIALLMALFVRGVYIWLFMVLSPFFGLMYFFGDKGPTKALSDKFSFDKFVGLAMMPVYVAGALSFGLLFILVAGKGMGASCTSNSICVKEEGDKSTVEFLGIKLIFNGTFSGSGEAKEILGGFKGAFGLLVLQIFGLAILRVSVMAALGSSELTKEVVAPIKQFGDSVGSLAAKAPTYMPIIPGPGGMMSAEGLKTFGANVSQHYASEAQKSGAAMSSDLFGDLSELKKATNDFKYAYNKNLGFDKQKQLLDEYLPKLKKAQNATEFKNSLKTMVDEGLLNESALKNTDISYTNIVRNPELVGRALHKESTEIFKKVYTTDTALINALGGKAKESSGSGNNVKDTGKIAEIKDVKTLGKEIGKVMKGDIINPEQLKDIVQMAKKGGVDNGKIRKAVEDNFDGLSDRKMKFGTEAAELKEVLESVNKWLK